MPVILCLANADGTIAMTPYQDATKRQFAKANAGKRIRLTLSPFTPESSSQRGFYHGAVIALWVHLDGNDYRNASILADYHEVAKLEFSPAIVIVHGHAKKIGKSTKGNLNAHIEKCIDFLIEQYGINPMEVLNPDDYKLWKDTIYPYGGPDNFISYLISIGKL